MNSDGEVGDRVAQTLSNQDKASHATGLYKTVSGAYVFDTNNLDNGQELQSPSSALIYNGKPYSFESEPVVAFRTEQHNSDPAQNNIKYNVF